jgi:hypothetical protein
LSWTCLEVSAEVAGIEGREFANPDFWSDPWNLSREILTTENRYFSVVRNADLKPGGSAPGEDPTQPYREGVATAPWPASFILTNARTPLTAGSLLIWPAGPSRSAPPVPFEWKLPHEEN